MLKLTMFEFVLRGFPEAFMLMLSLYTLSNTKLNHIRYIYSSLLLGICEYFIRLLPISYGVHTILNIFVMIIIMYSINKSDMVLAIKATLITTIVLYIIEGLNVLILNAIFRDKMEFIKIIVEPKVLYGLPSLIMFSIITITYYKKKKGV